MTYNIGLNPVFWKRVQIDDAYMGHREDLLRKWEVFCTVPVTALPYGTFKRFYIDGNREEYENSYFARRQGCNTAALLALIWPEEDKYLQRLQDYIFTICNEYTWVLPAHQKTLEQYDPLYIDLFAAETALILAEIYVLLKERLDPFICRRIEEELQRRILKPYKKNIFPWEKVKHNWAAVCTCGVAVTLMNLFPQEAKGLIPRFEMAIENFLSGYGEDGFCPEGTAYWGYGFGFFTVYAERLRTFCGIDHFKKAKVANIAEFLQKKYLSGGAEVTFCDTDLETQYNVGIQHFLYREYPNRVVIPPYRFAAYTDGMARMLCLHIRSFLWFNPDVEPEEPRGLHYGADVQWLICQKEHFGFAAKAGHNNENHNHNDIGSFIFAKNGRQIIADPGRGQYCRDYFGDKRYEFLHTSSKGHSVPIIGGMHQKNGPKFKATQVEWNDNTFSMELADAYDCSVLRSLKREFRLLDDGVILTDWFDCDETVVERFVTLEEPNVENGRICWQDTEMCFDSGCSVTVERAETVIDGGVIQVLYLIDILPRKGASHFSCRIV